MKLRTYFIVGAICLLLFLVWTIANAVPTDTVVRLKYKGTSVPCLLPAEISQEDIEVFKHASPVEFPMGGRLHCLVYGLNYGIMRAYVVEYWDNGLRYMEVVMLECVVPGQESKFWKHIWRPKFGFMLLRPITHEEWKEIVFYFVWGEGSK